MSKPSKGIWTIDESQKIEIGHLLKTGLIKNGAVGYGTLYLTNARTGERTGAIGISYDLMGDEKYIRLSYQIAFKDTGKREYFDYKIYIEAVRSNLGKGEVLYFICPETQKKCRILYMAYGSATWKSMEAYDNKIYYYFNNVQKLTDSTQTIAYWKRV